MFDNCGVMEHSWSQRVRSHSGNIANVVPHVVSNNSGFLGSSGIPSSTFPTRSALISAVFVYIPAGLGKAPELAPKLKPSNTVILCQQKQDACSKQTCSNDGHAITASLKPTEKAGAIPFSGTALSLAIVATLIPIFLQGRIERT